jgi:hypothetical protein
MSCLVGLEQLQELDISRCNGVDATTVSKVIADNQALSKLVFGGRGRDGQFNQAVPATLELGMTEVDFSDKNLGASGAIIIAAWITHKDSGAMTKFDISNCLLMPEGGKALAAGLKGNQVITELNISSNFLGSHSDTSGVIAIVDAIAGMGALSVTNFMGNRIGKEQFSKLQEIMHSEPNLVSLCGIADDATGADLSGLGMDADDALILASELPDKRALSHFNVSGNSLGLSGIQSICGSLLGDARFVCSVAVDYWTLLHCMLHAWCILITFPDQNRVLCALSYVTTRTYDSMLS